MDINDLLNTCLDNLKASGDFNDETTIDSIKDLLTCIIDNPNQLVNYQNEEHLSIALTSISVSQFPVDYPKFNGLNSMKLLFACSFYLYMHQLERGCFKDKNWPAFITLLHTCRKEFACFIVETNPFAPELVQRIKGENVDNQRSYIAAKGLELNMMLTAKRKGLLTEDLLDWYNELIPDAEDLLENDPFRREALPLYKIISNYLKANDVTFVNS